MTAAAARWQEPAGPTVLAALPRTLARFARSDAFVRCIVGPVGSGKSSACVTEILRRAAQQKPGPDGVRRSRFAVIRNTYGQLRDTTRKTFEQWIPETVNGKRLGAWNEQRFTFTMEFLHDDGKGNRHPLHCEVLFRALDRPEDVKKLLSLELTGAYINEAREIPKHVLDVLETRIGRYPSKAEGGASWSGIWMDTNPWAAGHWGAKLFARLGKGDGYELFRQPGGRATNAENVENLPPGYYDRLCTGKSKEWIRVYVDGEDASGDEGAVYGTWLAALEQRGDVAGFDHPMDAVYTSWDLGKSDSTAIWFWRIRDRRKLVGDRYVPVRTVDVIDYYENHGQGLGHYFEVIEGRGYQYRTHFLPHDARAETLATQQTVVERCVQRWGAEHVAITPQIGLDDGIDAGRWLLEEEQGTRIHERCGVAGRFDYSGLDVLRSYRFEWDEKNQCFSRVPVHNFASHGADAWRYLAVVAKQIEIATRPEPTDDRPVASPAHNHFTMDELWQARDRQRRWDRE